MPKEEKVKEIQKDLEVANNLEAVALSEGGKILLKNLAVDIVGNIERLGALHEKLTMQEFVALGASTKEKLALFRAIKSSKKNKDFLTDLLLETLNNE